MAEREHSESPVFHPGGRKQILLSPGTGAGWITYAPRDARDAFLVWMLTYEPMIRALERREHKDKLEDVLREFHREAHNRHHVDRLFVARVSDIEVCEVNFPFEVRETDGREKIIDMKGRETRGRRNIHM